MKTIFAPISPIAKSAITIIRISGDKTLESLIHLGVKKNLKVRQATLCNLIDPHNGEIIDQSLITFFSGPNSFTGEDVAEIAIHGSYYIIKKVTEILLQVKGVGLAQAGEFSKRAFLNGKMDLVQAEAIIDLIECETQAQHKQALRQMQGDLGKIYEKWREELIKITANIEAFIDFPDEDLPSDIVKDLEGRVVSLIGEIKNHLDDGNRGEKIRQGLSLAIIGMPNVGKSSLINYLAKSDVAIVSDIAGTTRDIIETHLSIAGVPVTIADTAGIRLTQNLVEKEGVKRALKKAELSDLKILMLDINCLNDYSNHDINKNTIVVINKIDLEGAIPQELMKLNPILISIKNNTNLDQLLGVLEQNIKDLVKVNESPAITRARYRDLLNKTTNHLSQFSLSKNIEFAAEDLRLAIRELGCITGKIGVEDILSAIFSGFCIGK